MTRHYYNQCPCPPCRQRKDARMRELWSDHGRYLPCPTCKAATGQPCINRRPDARGQTRVKPHPKRHVQKPTLPPSHLRVLRLVAQGMTDKVIADELGLNPQSVQTVVKRLRARIGGYDRHHAVEVARTMELIP